LPTDQATAFFSYSREDSEFALKLAEDLKAAGANVWLDQMDIEPGQRWARAVEQALTKCPRVLVILSPASVASTNVADEVAFALDEHKAVIPVLYRDCKIPFQLRPFQYVDFRKDYAQGLNVTLRTLSVEQQPTAKASALTANLAQAATALTTYGQLRQPLKDEQGAQAGERKPTSENSWPDRGDPLYQHLEDQISWYDRKSALNQRMYKRLRLLELLAAAMIAAIPGVSFALYRGVSRPLIGAMVGLIVLLPILEALLRLNRYHESWKSYRSTCESLRHEKYAFLGCAGPYASVADARGLLAERVESLVAPEYAKWSSSSNS